MQGIMVANQAEATSSRVMADENSRRIKFSKSACNQTISEFDDRVFFASGVCIDNKSENIKEWIKFFFRRTKLHNHRMWVETEVKDELKNLKIENNLK